MVRIWCVPVTELDRQHLLGEHKELHVIWSVIVNNKKGYSRHPETLRFKNDPYGIRKLEHRHEQQVREMQRRGYNHKSPLPQASRNLIIEPYSYTPEEYSRDHTELMKRQHKTVSL
jgi:hypothetical protein